MAKGAVGALAGTAAVGLAARAAIKKTRRPRVLGMTMPRNLKPGNLKPRNLKPGNLKPGNLKPGSIDVKKIAKQLTNVAERVEKTSEDVRAASAQAKRVTKSLS